MGDCRITSYNVCYTKLLREAEYIEVYGTKVTFKSKSFRTLDNIGTEAFDDELPAFAVKADKWIGEFNEYDLVSSLWPIIPEKLFFSLNHDFYVTKIGERVKTVGNYGNSLSGLAKIDPVLVHPKMGMFKKYDRGNFLKRTKNWVGKFEQSARITSYNVCYTKLLRKS